ncbi:MAG: glycosyltransferase family 4 protein [Candidatus Omnitrophica bacterium]|nr:glycosyltransferase family 4 protein [Candidatus Omnitrophota bacterium]
MKKLMIISPHNPFLRSNGGENRVYLITKELSKHNKIVLVCPAGKCGKESYKAYQPFEDKAKNKALNFKLLNKLRKIIKREKPDEIQLEFPWQGLNLILLGKRYILDEHNVEFLRFKRTGSRIWPIVYLYELLACKFAKKIVCVSETDKKYLIKYFRLNPNKIEIIENPVDTSIFYPNTKNNKKVRKELGLKKDEKFVLFFGQLDYYPNVEAIEIIKKNILPELEKKKAKYKLVICGKGNGKGSLKNFKHKNLIFKGFVDKIQDYINASDIVITPLKSGSGTRIKILEALACEKKVLSTSIGAEGINKNKFLELEDDWEKFAGRI